MTGFPTDSIAIGFEIKYDSAHHLKAYLYEPVLNFYGLELPGDVEEDSGSYVIRSYVVRLIPRGDTITGSYFPLHAPMRLVRVPALPSEAPIPAFPAGPGPAWRVKLDAPIYAPVAARDTLAYVGTTGGVFHAVNTRTAKVAWTFAAGRPMYGEPTVTDSAVYFVCDNGYLYKLDRFTGKEVWRYDLGGERASRVMPHELIYDFDIKAPRPVLAEGVLFVGSGDGSFHAVDASTGKRRWRVEGDEKVRVTAAIWGDLVIFGSWSGRVSALDRATGRERWRKETHDPVTSIPAVIGGKLIVGNWGGLVAALDPQTGVVAWRMLFWGSAVMSDPVDDSGMILIGASDLRRVSRIDPKDGRVLWRSDVYGWAWARPLIAGGAIYQVTASAVPYDMRHVSGFAELDRKTGAIRWRWPMPDWAGAFMNGFPAGAARAGDLVIAG
ncbi:MAG TPA: PQQ-binding-like beta-propeller repeat protein, partial [Dongiaceae bacterium]|nr:PQQ-binding-like beta-propeller repeat protein [Dongiaceae bacterium]